MSSNHQCNVFGLCLASIACLISISLIGIAFSTDNWVHISVDRIRLKDLADQETEAAKELKSNLESNMNYFDRVQGIFRICFPYREKPKPRWSTKNKSPTIGTDFDDLVLYLNPIEEWCTSINYYLQSFEAGIVPTFLTFNGTIWLHLIRSSIISFALYFMLMAIGCVLGLVGCWQASGRILISTAILVLVAALFGSAGMGLWHWARFYEIYKVHDIRLAFYQSWSELLKSHTVFSFGWSYIIAWVGVGLAYLTSVLFMISGCCFKRQFQDLNEGSLSPLHYGMMPPPQYPWPTGIHQHYMTSSIGSRSPPPPFTPYDLSSGYFSGYTHYKSHADTLMKGKYNNVVKEFGESKL